MSDKAIRQTMQLPVVVFRLNEKVCAVYQHVSARTYTELGPFERKV